MAGAKPRNLRRSVLKKLEILSFACVYVFLLMSFIVSNQHFLRQIQLYTVLTQGIRTDVIDQLQTSRIFKKVPTVLASKSSTVCHLVANPRSLKRTNNPFRSYCIYVV
jgi:hypothetical protein